MALSNNSFARPIISIIASTSLNAGQSGSIIALGAAAGAVTIKLPVAQVGLFFSFCCKVAVGQVVTVEPATDINTMFGTTLCNATALPLANNHAIQATNAIAVGDSLNVYCDGVNWICFGISSANTIWAGHNYV